MSTYPLRKLIPDATMASVCFLLPPGSQMIYLGAKKNSPSPLFVCTLCTLVMQCCPPPPHMPLSPLSDPMLSCLFFFCFFFLLVFRIGLATVKTVFLPYFLTYRCVGGFREYLPTSKTHSTCNDGICLLLASTRVPNDIFGGKKKFSFSIVCVYAMYACHAMSFPPPPHMPLSPLSDPMLSCLFFFFFFFSFEGRVGYGQNCVFAIFLTYR